MPLFDVINPSDAMTMHAPDILTAGAAVLLLGGGKIGARNIEGGDGTPVLFGWEDWYKERGVEDVSDWIGDHLAEVADALESVMLGSPNDRTDLDEALRLMPKEAREAYIQDRNDRRRSSCSDWETYAHDLAGQLRSKIGIAPNPETRGAASAGSHEAASLGADEEDR